jgi:hypothetical protein
MLTFRCITDISKEARCLNGNVRVTSYRQVASKVVRPTQGEEVITVVRVNMNGKQRTVRI